MFPSGFLLKQQNRNPQRKHSKQSLKMCILFIPHSSLGFNFPKLPIIMSRIYFPRQGYTSINISNSYIIAHTWRIYIIVLFILKTSSRHAYICMQLILFLAGKVNQQNKRPLLVRFISSRLKIGEDLFWLDLFLLD